MVYRDDNSAADLHRLFRSTCLCFYAITVSGPGRVWKSPTTFRPRTIKLYIITKHKVPPFQTRDTSKNMSQHTSMCTIHVVCTILYMYYTCIALYYTCVLYMYYTVYMRMMNTWIRGGQALDKTSWGCQPLLSQTWSTLPLYPPLADSRQSLWDFNHAGVSYLI